MTIVDLISEFRLLYDLGALALPGLEDDEIKKYLQRANYRIISQKIEGNNVYKTKFPHNEMRINDLLGLVSISSALSWGGLYGGNYVLVQLPDDFLYMYELKIYTAGRVQFAKQINISLQSRFIENGLSAGNRNYKAYLKQPVYLYIDSSSGSKRLKLYFDGEQSVESGSTDIYCTYVKTPTNLEMVADATTLSDYQDKVYHELVESAVNEVKGILSPESYQISSQQLNKSE